MDSQAPAEDAVRTAIAVCGCGHDGRLGIGSDTPSTLHEIALLDDFLSAPAHDGGPSSSVQAPGGILQVACGAYHTLLRTTVGLYGWGSHEDGQLGLGRPSKNAAAAPAAAAAASTTSMVNGGDSAADVDRAVVPAFFERPTPIPLFHLINGERRNGTGSGHAPTDAAVQGEIVSIYCGADHSLVRTTVAVYVTGRNDCGQLGLGHMEAVYTWTFLCSVAAPLHGAASFRSLPSHTRSDGSCDRVLQGTLTHISGGTHHTLLALSDALLLRSTTDEAASAPQSRLFFYPTLLLACGRGDFGELGYDGDAWAVLQAKAQRQERALLAEAVAQQKRGLTTSTGSRPDIETGTAAYPFKWKAAAGVKQRRPPFSSPFLQPVEVRELTDCATELPAASAREIRAALVLDDFASEGDARLAPSTSDALRQLLDGNSGSPPRDTATKWQRHWEVESLQAMHHHSAVTLREVKASTPVGAAPLLVLHWGCYYCAEIEDAAASTPRPLFSSSSSSNDDDDDKANSAAKHLPLGLFAGDEVLFRYNVPLDGAGTDASVALTGVQVMGTGNLGRGSDEDEARTWVDVPLFPVIEPHSTQDTPFCVSSISGRAHFLLAVSKRTTTSSSSSVEAVGSCDGVSVMGFGDNLHGQLGAPAARAKAELSVQNNSGDEDDNAVLTPRLVLGVGDTLRTASAVQKSLQQAAVSRAHRRSAEKGRSEADCADRWVVEKIRAAGAGARHSVFVVDVRPLKMRSGSRN